MRKQKNRLRLYIPSVKSLARRVCPPGQIERKAYVRKYTSTVRKQGFTVSRNGKTYKVLPSAKSAFVKSKCIKSSGTAHKSVARIGPLRKGELAKHGYSFRTDEAERHRALRQAVEEFGALGVFRKLDAVAKLTSSSIPAASAVYKKDRNWIESAFGPLKAFKK